jgi:hypothetical protein
MRPWRCVLSALPVFLLGCVAVLIAYQIRLGYLQAASIDYGALGVPGGSRGSLSARGGAAAAGAADLSSLHGSRHAAARGGHHQRRHQHQQHGSARAQQHSEKDTLVVYIYNEADPVFTDNFNFFLLAGVQQDSRWAAAAACRAAHTHTQRLSMRTPLVPICHWMLPCPTLTPTACTNTPCTALHPWRTRTHAGVTMLSSCMRQPSRAQASCRRCLA